jgi:hypothetical protein
METRIAELKATLATLKGSNDTAAAGVTRNLQLQIDILCKELRGRKG